MYRHHRLLKMILEQKIVLCDLQFSEKMKDTFKGRLYLAIRDYQSPDANVKTSNDLKFICFYNELVDDKIVINRSLTHETNIWDLNQLYG